MDLVRGRFFRPKDVSTLLMLPIRREPAAGDPIPLALPVLLTRIAAHAGISGILTLTRGHESVPMHLIKGHFYLVPAERNVVTRAFTWPEGEYSFESKELPLGTRPRASLGRLLSDGFRALGRDTVSDEMERGLGSRLDLAPVIKADGARLLDKIGLLPTELRFAKRLLDGSMSGRDLVLRGGLGRHTTLWLLTLVVIFDLVSWQAVKVHAQKSLPEQLVEMASELEAGNHFDALGVHWSSPQVEIDKAYEKLVHTLDPCGEWSQAAPQVCKQMRARVEAAYDVLRDADKRAIYRKEIYDFDFNALTDVAEQRISALTMKGARAEAEETRASKGELRSSSKIKIPPGH